MRFAEFCIPAGMAFALDRIEPAVLAHQHLVLDERFVQVPLENHASPLIRGKAAEFRKNAERFKIYWTAHIADWPSERVISSWSSYRLSVHKLITKMKNRLALEKQDYILSLHPAS